MVDSPTERKMEDLRNHIRAIDDKLDLLAASLNTRFDSVDGRLDSIERRIDGVDTRFDTVDTRLNSIDTRFDTVDTRLNSIDTRFDSVGAASDAAFVEQRHSIRLCATRNENGHRVRTPGADAPRVHPRAAPDK
jgi:tetrahydromethanopterin S-methyltransferase subunit G